MSRQGKHVPAAKVSQLHAQTIAELRREVNRLEKVLEDRKLLFVDLCETGGASVATTPASDTAGAFPNLPPIGAAAKELAAEMRNLAARNAFLAGEIKILESIERQYASDPRVLDKRNEIRLVRMQIAQVEREVSTLQTVKKRRDIGLRAIGKSEEQVRRARGQQHGVDTELRDEVKQLMEEFRGLEKTDIDAHERCARLQDQLKLSVTDADVRALRDEIKKYEEEIELLSAKEVAKETALRQRGSTPREDDHSRIVKLRRECAALEEEEAHLQQLLHQKDAELKRSYQGVGRLRFRSDGNDAGEAAKFPAAK
ncbi:hypothetical protein ABL78_1786 [Leptomonas seymouri]|uniref:Uncharacterized protein n=1 Tax=Leptomonas seymouri TaxID=5684 RepID=A0A0N1IM76_LEPSE|nr:hypothetical protein ABL78_1786 [Leptomonas seymouri]|eukprot:KPI89142.1 hypothetical protein ABL78_1786 [Leptomonas seymouri]